MAHFAGSARLTAAHEISLSTAFELAATMGIAMPGKVEIFAVEAGDARTLTEDMTPAVTAAVEPLARDIHALLKERGSSEGEARDASGEEWEDPPRRPFYGP